MYDLGFSDAGGQHNRGHQDAGASGQYNLGYQEAGAGGQYNLGYQDGGVHGGATPATPPTLVPLQMTWPLPTTSAASTASSKMAHRRTVKGGADDGVALLQLVDGDSDGDNSLASTTI